MLCFLKCQHISVPLSQMLHNEPWPQHQYQIIVQKSIAFELFFSLRVFLTLISKWHTGPPPGNEWMKTFKIGLHHPMTTGHADLEYITLQSWMRNSTYSEIQYLMWDCCAAGYLLLFKFHINCYSHPHSVGSNAMRRGWWVWSCICWAWPWPGRGKDSLFNVNNLVSVCLD